MRARKPENNGGVTACRKRACLRRLSSVLKLGLSLRQGRVGAIVPEKITPELDHDLKQLVHRQKLRIGRTHLDRKVGSSKRPLSEAAHSKAIDLLRTFRCLPDEVLAAVRQRPHKPVPDRLRIDPPQKVMYIPDAKPGLQRGVRLDKITPYLICHVMCRDRAIHGVASGIRLLHKIIEILQQLLVEVA
jgi:hypothetical protein